MNFSSSQPPPMPPENAEPGAGNMPVPVWLMVLLFVLLYGAMVFFDRYSGGSMPRFICLMLPWPTCRPSSRCIGRKTPLPRRAARKAGPSARPGRACSRAGLGVSAASAEVGWKSSWGSWGLCWRGVGGRCARARARRRAQVTPEAGRGTLGGGPATSARRWAETTAQGQGFGLGTISWPGGGARPGGRTMAWRRDLRSTLRFSGAE